MALQLAARGDRLALAARDLEECERIAADCRVRHGAEAVALPFDAEGPGSPGAALVDQAAAALGGLDGVVVTHGAMWSPEQTRADPALLGRMRAVNLASAGEIALRAAATVGRGGFVCLVSSVAGDRGRASNFAYGATKAGLSAFGEGLGASMWREGIAIIIIKPGVIDSAMTWGLGEEPGADPGPLTGGLACDPAIVARDIVRAIDRRRRVVYTPAKWRWIMLVIRWLPWFVFRRVRF